MDIQLSNGKRLTLPDNMSDQEMISQIKEVEEIIQDQSQTKDVVEDESFDLWGPHMQALSPGKEPPTSSPLPEGKALRPTKELLEYDKPIEETFNPLLAATASGGLVGRAAIKAGVPLAKAAIQALTGGVISGAADYPVGIISEDVLPSKWQPYSSIGLGLLSGIGEDKLLRGAIKAGGKLASAVRKPVEMKPINEVIDTVADAPSLRSKIEQTDIPETPPPNKIVNKSIKAKPKPPKTIETTGDVRADIPIKLLKGKTSTGRDYESLETGSFGAVKTKSGKWGFYVRDAKGSPKRVEDVGLVDNQATAGDVLGQVRRQIKIGVDEDIIDLKPIVEGVKQSRKKVSLDPERGDVHIFGKNVPTTKVGRYGATKYGERWLVFDGDSSYVDSNKGLGFKFFGKMPFETEDEAIDAMQYLTKKRIRGEKFGQVTEMRSYWKNLQTSKDAARDQVKKVLSKAYKYGEDDLPADLVKVAMPIFKGKFAGVEKVTRADLVSTAISMWKENSHIKNGVVSPGTLGKLNEISKTLDWVHTWSNVKGNVDEINKEITRALDAKKITTTQAALMREMNKHSNAPLTFGLNIAPRKGARASYSGPLRLMMLDPDRDGPFVYTHEFGHWGFWEVLDSADRLAVTREIGRIVEDGNLTKYIPMATEHPGLMTYEGEIFAEMFSQYALTHVLPETLSKKVVNGIVKVAKATKAIALKMLGKETVEPGMKKYFEKLAWSPDPNLQPGKFESVYLPKGALATMSEEEAVEALNKSEFLRPAKVSSDTVGEMFGGKMEVIDPDEVGLDPAGRILFADWMRNMVEYELKPGNMNDSFEMLERARLALRPLVDPSKFDYLVEKLGGDKGLARSMRGMAESIAESLDQRAVKMDLPPLATHPAESAHKLMEDTYMGTPGDGPSWRNPLTQARLGPAVLMGSVGGLEFNTEDGVEVPFLNNMKIGFSPTKALIYGGAVLGATNFPGALLKKGTKSVTEKLWNKIEKNAPNLYDVMTKFHPTLRTDEKVYGAMSEFLRTRPAISRQFEKQVQQLRETFTNDELVMISDIIEKEGTEWMRAPQILKDQAESIQRWIKDVRDSLVDAGIPVKDIDKYGTAYLPRAYSKKVKVGKSATETRSLLRSLYGDYLMKRGMVKKFDPAAEDISTAISDLGGLDKIRPGQKILQFNRIGGEQSFYVAAKNKVGIENFKKMGDYILSHEWEVEKFPSKTGLQLRRDYTKNEREMMGEVRNAGYRLAKFIRQASHDVALGQAFKRIAQNQDHVIDPAARLSGLKKGSQQYKDEMKIINTKLEDHGFKKVPPTKIGGTDAYKFGSLAGKYVTPEVYRILQSMTNTRFRNESIAKIHKVWSNGTKMWKIGKTAFNPATHGYNWVANAHMCAFDGRNPITVIGHGVKHLMTKDEVYERAVKAGMLDSNVLRGELDLGKFLSEIERTQYEDVVTGGANLLDSLWKFGKNTGKKGLYKSLRTYEIGDEIFKLGVFSQELRKGAVDLDAIKAANKLFFDYRDIPPGVAFLRDWGIMPFVSYTYKAIPVVARTMVDNPHRILGTLLFYQMLNEISYGIDYGPDAAKQKEYEKRNMPKYMKEQGGTYGVGPSTIVRVPKKLREKFGGRTIEGQAEFVDMSHSIPLGDIFSDSGIFSNYPFAFHPIASLSVGLLKGIDPMFLKQITTPEPITEKDRIDNAKAITKFAVRTLLPNLPFIPGQYSYEKMGNAMTSAGVIPPEVANKAGWTGQDYYGGQVSLPKELFSMAGILKFRNTYPGQEFLTNVKKAGGGIYKSVNKVKRGVMDKRTTQDELQGMIGNVKNTIATQATAIKALAAQRRAAPDPNLMKYSTTPRQ